MPNLVPARSTGLREQLERRLVPPSRHHVDGAGEVGGSDRRNRARFSFLIPFWAEQRHSPSGAYSARCDAIVSRESQHSSAVPGLTSSSTRRPSPACPTPDTAAQSIRGRDPGGTSSGPLSYPCVPASPDSLPAAAA